MQAIQMKTHVGNDGILKLELPINVRNADVELMIVMQTTETAVDENGWPIGFFEATYGSLADDPIERQQ